MGSKEGVLLANVGSKEMTLPANMKNRDVARS
jgi:hypothetical protein